MAYNSKMSDVDRQYWQQVAQGPSSAKLTNDEIDRMWVGFLKNEGLFRTPAEMVANPLEAETSQIATAFDKFQLVMDPSLAQLLSWGFKQVK